MNKKKGICGGCSWNKQALKLNENKQYISYITFIAVLYLDIFFKKKLIIDTRIEILYLRQTRVSSTKESSVTLESKMLKRPNKVQKWRSSMRHQACRFSSIFIKYNR